MIGKGTVIWATGSVIFPLTGAGDRFVVAVARARLERLLVVIFGNNQNRRGS